MSRCVKLTGQAFNAASQEVNVSGHKHKIGQLVDYLGRERASGVYQITQLMPPEGVWRSPKPVRRCLCPQCADSPPTIRADLSFREASVCVSDDRPPATGAINRRTRRGV